MGVLSYRCPDTSHEVTTGIETDAAGLARVRSLKLAVACPHCPDGHVVTADTMVVLERIIPAAQLAR